MVNISPKLKFFASFFQKRSEANGLPSANRHFVPLLRSKSVRGEAPRFYYFVTAPLGQAFSKACGGIGGRASKVFLLLNSEKRNKLLQNLGL